MTGTSTDLDADVSALLERRELEPAATLVLRRLGPEILRYLRSLVGSDADAHDAFSQFAENLWVGIAGFRGDAKIRTWAYRLAFHAAGRIHRDPYRRRAEPLSGAAAELVHQITSGSSRERRTRLERGLERARAHLDDTERTLLVLRIDRALSWSEIAEILTEGGVAIGEAALRKRFERLKGKLRALAKDDDPDDAIDL